MRGTGSRARPLIGRARKASLPWDSPEPQLDVEAIVATRLTAALENAQQARLDPGGESTTAELISRQALHEGEQGWNDTIADTSSSEAPHRQLQQRRHIAAADFGGSLEQIMPRRQAAQPTRRPPSPSPPPPPRSSETTQPVHISYFNTSVIIIQLS